jgi:peptidoglycan/xylan/chitin deacetylase (PgdA/CDA1 family)
MSGTAFLMYHEIEQPGRATVSSAAGYLRYVVAEADFRQHLAALRRGNWSVASVGDALEGLGGDRRVALTFDDGAATDRWLAAPLLREHGFGATFYVVAGWLGRRGQASAAELRELAGMGFEIGSHSMTHPRLTDLDAAALGHEIAGSKDLLEQRLGTAVHHFACPGGRVSRAVVRAAKEAGYRSLATSVAGLNAAGADAFGLRRLAIHRGTTAAEVERLCAGRGLRSRRGRQWLLATARALVGNRRYERIRTTLLEAGERA